MAYPGGKSGAGVYQALINLMPPHENYIEPFLGGGAIMRLKKPARVNIGLDLDPDVIASWSTGVRNGGWIQNPEPLKMAAAAAVAGGGDFAGRVARSDVRRRHGTVKVATPAAAASSSDGGSQFHFAATDAITYLRSEAEFLDRRYLVYCDPPYLRSTRASTGDQYRYEMTDRQHEELLSVIVGLDCHVMISGYSSALYARVLRKWNTYCFQAATRGKPAAEWVWYNFPKPVELHDYRYIGDSKRERERIRRKQRRWTNRLRIMPTLERQALLSAIAEVAE